MGWLSEAVRVMDRRYSSCFVLQLLYLSKRTKYMNAGRYNIIFRCFLESFINNDLSAWHCQNFHVTCCLYLFPMYCSTWWLTSPVCAAVLMTPAGVNDPVALSQSVSLSYLSTAYRIQRISSLLWAVLTFRQASPFRENCWHTYG